MTEKVQIPSHVRSMVGADGAVLLDLKAGKYYSLNPVGATIWTKAEEGLTLPEILAHLDEKYPVGVERLQREITTFVEGLTKKGLLHASL